MPTPETTEICAATIEVNDITCTCALLAGHKDAHEDPEHEAAWGTDL